VKVFIERGDLTEKSVDTIVNAANNDLILGGGVAGAIKRRGGPAIQADCDRHGPVRVGEAAITTAGELPAKYVIHAASMRLGGKTTEDALRTSTRHSLMLAEERGLRSIAFPAVGTGIAGFPMERCAEIMLGAVNDFAQEAKSVEEVYFVLFDEPAHRTFLDVQRKNS